MAFILLIKSGDSYSTCGAGSDTVKVPQCVYSSRRECPKGGKCKTSEYSYVAISND